MSQDYILDLLKNTIIKNHNIKFNNTLKLGEDTCFLHNYLCHIDSISIIRQTGYHYFVARRGSKYSFSETDLCNTVQGLESCYNELSKKWHFENFNYLNFVVYKIPFLLYLFTQKGSRHSFSISGYCSFKKTMSFISQKVSIYCCKQMVDFFLLLGKYKMSVFVFIFVRFVWPSYVWIKGFKNIGKLLHK